MSSISNLVRKMHFNIKTFIPEILMNYEKLPDNTTNTNFNIKVIQRLK